MTKVARSLLFTLAAVLLSFWLGIGCALYVHHNCPRIFSFLSASVGFIAHLPSQQQLPGPSPTPTSQFFEFEFLFDDDSEAKGKSGELGLDWNEDDRLSHRVECDYMNQDPVRELSAPAINTSSEGGQRAHLPLPQQYDFALVADLDKGSRDPKKFEWHSIMQVRAVPQLLATTLCATRVDEQPHTLLLLLLPQVQKATLRRNERGNFTIEWGETIK
jgi:hypothetical protein